jgi:hypothetical protein
MQHLARDWVFIVPSWLLEVGTGDSPNPLSDDDDDDESLLGLFKYNVSATGVTFRKVIW